MERRIWIRDSQEIKFSGPEELLKCREGEKRGTKEDGTFLTEHPGETMVLKELRREINISNFYCETLI